MAAGYDADTNTIGLQQLYAMAVQRIECFENLALIAKVKLAIGQDAVHIKQQQRYAGCAASGIGRVGQKLHRYS